MLKTKTHFIQRIGWQGKLNRSIQFHVIGLLILMNLLWSLLTNTTHAQVSTLQNNCLGTGGLSAELITFLNAKFVSSWPTQNKCLGDVAVSVVASGDLLSGNIMQYNVTVTNNGPRRSYNSRVIFTGTNGLVTSGSAILNYGQMAPGTSQMLSLFVLKTANTSTGIVVSTGTFTLDDPTLNDTNTGNNIITHRPIVRGSTRAVCYHPDLNIPSYECDALMDLYTSTNGAGWTNKTNWGTATDVETWFGVTLTTVGGKKYVRDICLSNAVEGTACNYQYQGTAGNNMAGPLPTSIGLFSELTTLALSNNTLGGTIPVELTNLKKASKVLLASTNLTGTLPTTIGNMTALKEFDITSNNLGGVIPSGLGSTSLTHLWASNNKFTILPDLSSLTWQQIQIGNNLLSGSLPSWIGTESGITHLRLDQNNFSGPIPSSWSGLTSLTNILLYQNMLTGSLDVFSGLNVSQRQVIKVQRNNFDRDSNNNAIVPPNIQARLSSMSHQDLTNQGDITPPLIAGTGVVPQTIDGTFDYTLIVSENSSTTGAGYPDGLTISFTGASICQQALITTNKILNRNGSTTITIVAFEPVTYSGCQLYITDRAGLNSNLITLPTFTSNEYGICNTVTDITKSDCKALIDLYYMTKGSSWTTNTNWRGIGDSTLTTACDWYGIQCSSGRVTGICLNGSGSACNGSYSVAGNNLVGTLPDSIGNLTGLVNLMMQNSSLTGILPSTLQNIKTLTNIYLQENNIGGNLPDLATGLVNIYLGGNEFIGSIPASWCNISNISQLYLPDNQLSGMLPSCFANYTNAYTIALQNNQFTGELPISWSSLTGLQILHLYNNQLSGPIPSSWGSMVGLTTLKIHDNNLRGFIPSSLMNLTNLVSGGGYLNNNCLSSSSSYMSTGLQTFLNSKFNNWGSQKNCPGVIGSRVWIDTDNDGIYDNGETGTGGIIVTLRACADQLPVNTHKLINHQLLRHYTFDDSNLLDTVSNTPIGITNGAVFTGNKIGTAVGFNGNSDYIDTLMKVPARGDGTVTVWFRGQGQTNSTGSVLRPIIMQGDFTTGSGPEALEISMLATSRGSHGHIRFSWGDDDLGSSQHYSVNLDDNQRHFAAITREGNQIKGYINGVQVVQFTDTSEVSQLTNILIGGSNTLSSRKFKGLVDDVRIYSRALSASEISQLYNVDAANNSTNIPISYAGAIIHTTTTLANGSYSFTNITGGKYYVEYSNIPNGYKFTTQNWGGYHNSANSDVNPWSAKSSCFELYNGLNEIDIDAGIRYLPYSSCEITTPAYTPILVRQPVSIDIAGYGQNAQFTISSTGNSNTALNKIYLTGIIANEGTNRALKTRNTIFIPQAPITYTVSGSVDGYSDRLEYYDSVTNSTAYKVLGPNQWCAVSQANMGPQIANLTTINQIATIPQPVVYCTPSQISDSGLPYATTTNQPTKMLIKVPSCKTTLVATSDATMLCNYITDMSPAECITLVQLYDATEGRVSCGTENMFCSFTGTRQVRYGNGGVYNYLTGTAGISCNNSTFGDPIIGGSKQCWYKMDSGTWTNESKRRFVGDTTPRTACDWFGVTCAGGSITSIDLSSNNLQGTLTGISWSNLRNISQIDLYNNKIGGELPQLHLVPTLQTIRLGYNNFTGILPSNWSLLPSLLELNLADAGLFSGSLPETWTGLADTLTKLHVGSILSQTGQLLPSWLGQMTKLTELYIYDNGFADQLTNQFSTLTGLKVLQLQSNNIYGNLQTIPLPTLTALYSSSYGGTKSAIDTNCLYTGSVAGSTGTFLDARFNFTSNPVTNWRNQKHCPTDLELSTVNKSGNLMTGLLLTYTITYQNSGSIPSYAPKLSMILHSGLYLMSGSSVVASGSRPYVISLPELAPGQTGQYSFTISKMGLGSGLHAIVNQFTISDSFITDLNLQNNSFTDTDNARGSSYPICIHPQISIQTYECESLGDLFYWTSGSGWTTKTNWMTSTDVESWHGITLTNLTGVNYVQKICLSDETEADTCKNVWEGVDGNNLSGTIPMTIGYLSELTDLRLYKNNISGSLPWEFANLDKLTQIGLYGNKVTSIGTGIGDMAKLDWLYIENNLITSLPPELANAPVLTKIWAGNNPISSIADLSNLGDTLQQLNLSSIPWNKPLPAWIANLRSLNNFRIDSSGVTGTLDILTGLSNLNILEIQNNDINGTLPASWSNKTTLYLQNNKITGSLPSTWSNLTGLQNLNLSNNTGINSVLPSSWSGMRALKVLNLSGTTITGEIPSSWFSAMTGITDFIIPNTELDGLVPITGFQNWTFLKISPITSTVANNCMYTGFATPTQQSWMDTFMSWRTQKKCDTDLQITITKSGTDYNPGKLITYTITYRNLGPRWSYLPMLQINLNTGIVISGTTISNTGISLGYLAPGASGQVVITATKRGTGQGTGIYTNKFTIGDTATTDSLTGNNVVIDSGIIRWFKYNECIDITDVPQVECEALMDFYTFTDGSGWVTKTNWAGIGDPTPTTLCDWYGVVCSAGRVNKLWVDGQSGANAGISCYNDSYALNNNLSGTLQPSISDMTTLTQICLGNSPKLIGTIPLSLWNMNSMSILTINQSNLQDTLPTIISGISWNMIRFGPAKLYGQLPKNFVSNSMQTFFVCDNQFTGTLPVEWASHPTLNNICIAGNSIGGTLPTQRGNWSGLVNFWGGRNQLTGSLPSSWSGMTKLQNLTLNDNQLSGPLPSSRSSLTSLQNLYLGINQLTGSLPSSWGNMTGLIDLRLNNNDFTGTTLPSSWSGMTSLEYLDVGGTNLSGRLPSSWSSLSKLKTLRINSNKFFDDIPSGWFTGMKAMQNFIAFDNDLAGPIDILLRQNWTGLATNGSDSVISNNCLYTDTVVGGYLTWMDTYFGAQYIKSTSSWTPQYYWKNQKRCSADLELTGMVVTGNLYTGAFMTYTITYRNDGISRAYVPTISVSLHSGLELISGGRTTSISLGYLRPYASGQVVIPIKKVGVGSGTEVFTNTFIISDSISDDNKITNNTIIHTGIVKRFKYPICGSIQDISQVECEALGDFYTSLDGSGWNNKLNWMGLGDVTDTTACDWFGVSCVADSSGLAPRTVDKLCLSHTNSTCSYVGSGNNLSGLLNSSIGDLLNLTELVISNNDKIGGVLPSSIGQLTKLTILYATNTSFTGGLPDSMANLNQLKHLYLGGNDLQGGLPSSWGTGMASIEYIDLDGNFLSGPIPLSWSGFADTMTSLVLSNQRGAIKLNGTIPSWLGNFSKMNYTLRLNNNQFTGSIPVSLAQLTGLQELWLSTNMISGPIPTELSNLRNLKSLYLHINQLTGQIPSSLGSLTGLTRLLLSNNQLTGTLPVSFSGLRSLTHLQLNNNNLNGEIPSSWSVLTGLTTFTIANNNIDGLIPSWMQSSYTSLGTNSSTISNNCMYTGYVSGTFLTYMNNKFGSNWQSQKICATDPALISLGVVGSLETGNIITYAIKYQNNGPRWSYAPMVTLYLSTGLAVNNTTGSVTSLVGPLAPGQSGFITYPVNKYNYVFTGIALFTNQFVISDTSTSDIVLPNNTLIHTGLVRGSPYPVCRSTNLTVSQYECESLMDIYMANNGSGWINKANRGVSPDVDTWFGVTVQGGRVTKLNLSNSVNDTAACDILSSGNNLRGQLSSSIGGLIYLTELCLGNNDLDGVIPPTINDLTGLTILSLHHNSIDGLSIPLTNLSGLTMLDLSYNQLSGSIATLVDGLPELRNLWLNNNALNEGLSYVSRYSKLQGLRLQFNQFTGTLPSSWSSLTFMTQLSINHNYFDRDHLNNAIIPLSLQNWYNSLAVKNNISQGDISSPLISNISAIPTTISTVSFPVTFTINENSYASGLYTAGPYSGQMLSGLYVTVSGSSLCQTISSDAILSHSGSITVSLYPETNGSYTNCEVFVYDRAYNRSNVLILSPFNYIQPPYRLHLMMGGSGVVLSGNSLQSIKDRSPFNHQISMINGIPSYMSSILNTNPAVQFDGSKSLATPGIFRKQSFDNITILVVAKPGSTSENLLLEQSSSGIPLVLSTNSWRLGGSLLPFTLPSSHHSLIVASHNKGGMHQVRINGTTIAGISTNEGLQITGISVSTIGSGLQQGLLGELIVYTNSLDLAGLNYLESYLALKYGITLPTSYVATTANGSIQTIWSYNETYQHQVVGLGYYPAGPLPITQLVSTAASGSTITIQSRGARTTGQYVMIGSNSGALEWNRTMPTNTGYKLLGRTWYVQKTGGDPLFAVSVKEDSIAEFNFAPTIFVSNDPSFTTITSSGMLVKNDDKWVSSGVTINDGQYITFGVSQSKLGGRVWLDLNRDGIQSPSEQSIAGVVVRLYQCPTTQSQPWYLYNYQASTGIIAEVTTYTGMLNFLFNDLNPGSYYVTYDRSNAIIDSSDAISPSYLTGTKNGLNNQGVYNGGAVWSDQESYGLWKNKPSTWYGPMMSSLSGVILSTIDSDMMSNDYPQSGIPYIQQSSRCYTLSAGTNQQSLGAGLMITNSTDIVMTHSLNTNSINNTSGARFNVNITVSNEGIVRSQYSQVVVTIPDHTHIEQILSNGEPVAYYTSGSQIKLYIGTINPNQTLSYTISLIYDGLGEDGDQMIIKSKLMSTTIDTNTANNMPQDLSVTLLKYGATIGNKAWIDFNNNGIQDEGDSIQPGINGLRVELYRADTRSLVKGPKIIGMTGGYVFTSIDPGQYYIYVTNLPKGYTFAQRGLSGTTVDNDSNINASTNESDIFTVVTGVDNLSIDIGLRPLNPLTQCTTIKPHKLRMGKSYLSEFYDIYTPTGRPNFGTRLFEIKRSRTEQADYNASPSLPDWIVYNYGAWGATTLGYLESMPKQTVQSFGNPYTVTKMPSSRTASGYMVVSYEYLGCTTSPLFPGYCISGFRHNNCHTYEITSCGDNIVDTYSSEEYPGANRGSEECDFGSNNGTSYVSEGGIQCSRECTIVTTKKADLGISKTDIQRNICELPGGSDGILGSTSSSTGSIAPLVNGTVSSTLIIGN